MLEAPFEVLHAQGGVPTGQIQTRFSAPSRHGDHLELRLIVTRVGGSPMDYTMTAHAGEELRFTTTATLVHVGPEGRSALWPDTLRARLNAFKDETS